MSELLQPLAIAKLESEFAEQSQPAPKVEHDKTGVLMGTLFATVGVGVLVVVAFMVVDNIRFITSSQRAEGVIVRVESRSSTDSDGDTSTSYYPVVSFRVGDQDYTARSGNSVPTESDYVEGQRVTVLFNPTNPPEARIESFSTMWLLVTVLGVFGGGFFGLGFLGRQASGGLTA